jgi:anti-sigma B factor antagonist
MEDLRIELSPGSRDGVRILKLIGPFTLKDVFEFQTIVRRDIAPLTVIDLSQVPYMDSAALGSLLGFHVSCQRYGVHYALVAASGRLQTLFKVARVDGLLALYTNVPEAEASLAIA